MAEMICRRCGRNAHQIGGYLERMNAKGQPGVWECRPGCWSQMTPDEAMLAAVEGPAAPPAPEGEANG